MDMDESEGWCSSKEVASTTGGNVGSHSEANNVELSVTLTSCNREVTGSMWTRAYKTILMSTFYDGLCAGAGFHEALKCIRDAVKDVLNVSKSQTATMNRRPPYVCLSRLVICHCARATCGFVLLCVFHDVVPPCASETKCSFRDHKVKETFQSI